MTRRSRSDCVRRIRIFGFISSTPAGRRIGVSKLRSSSAGSPRWTRWCSADSCAQCLGVALGSSVRFLGGGAAGEGGRRSKRASSSLQKWREGSTWESGNAIDDTGNAGSQPPVAVSLRRELPGQFAAVPCCPCRRVTASRHHPVEGYIRPPVGFCCYGTDLNVAMSIAGLQFGRHSWRRGVDRRRRDANAHQRRAPP